MSAATLILIAALAQTPIINVMGQSLAIGFDAGGSLTTTQPYSNVMPSTLAYDTTNLWMSVDPTAWPMTALIESATLESPRSGLANYFRSVTGVDVAVAMGAKGSAAYVGIAKGTAPYNYWTQQVESMGARSKSWCRATYFDHGESDAVAGTARSTYAANIYTLQQDVQAKCIASTTSGLTGLPVPLFLDQNHSYTANSLATSAIPFAQYDAARARPGLVSLVGPKYQYVYNAVSNHLVGTAYRQAGAVAGKAVAFPITSSGTTWQPLWPVCTEFPNPCTTSPVTRTASVITLQLYVPVCPLVFGAAPMTGVSSSTHGFEYTDSAGAGTISSVVSGGACTNHVQPVTITLSADPTGHTAKLLRYAYTGTSGNSAGPTSGVRGDICDSDPATWQGASLQNCLVTFEEAVP